MFVMYTYSVYNYAILLYVASYSYAFLLVHHSVVVLY